MSEEEIIREFENIVEESRVEDNIEHYFKLYNTLELIKKLQKENEELKEQRDNAIKLRNELIEEQKITCVSKNKIRNKIKELKEELKNKSVIDLEEYAKQDTISVLGKEYISKDIIRDIIVNHYPDYAIMKIYELLGE